MTDEKLKGIKIQVSFKRVAMTRYPPAAFEALPTLLTWGGMLGSSSIATKDLNERI
jgi:hypothetical protein